MAGHSKWNNIKNRKGAVDAKRSKIFAQLSKQIKIAVKEGKSDNPQFNAGLRMVLDKARAANMPKDKIQRALERGMGTTAAGASLQEVLYEGFGPGGVGLLIQAVTDNNNRSSSDIRYILSRHGGSLGGPNSAKYLFERKNDGSYVVTMPMDISETDSKQLMQLIEKLEEHEDVEDVYAAISSEEAAVEEE
ncbi:MAG: YebC/PmpR family DNA-binding transcriptional regulator [Patescibacteria group bacterium]